MNKRLIMKTALICVGIFIILASVAVYMLKEKYDLDTEKRINVVISSQDIMAGEVINETMIQYRTIRESALTTHMATNIDQCTNSMTSVPIKSGDYIFSYHLLSPDIWQSNDARIIVLPMTIDERLANLIKKGSVIDIKVLPTDEKIIPKLVLSHIAVSDVLDENGLSLGDAIGSRKGYVVVVLDKEQRNRIYAAMQYGKLMYELYCDLTQPKDTEDFVIPQEFLKYVRPEQYMIPKEQTSSNTDGGVD